jgi:hypothetical protein
MSDAIYATTNVSNQPDLASICGKYPRLNIVDVNYDFEVRGHHGLVVRIKTLSEYGEEGDQYIDVRIADIPSLIALIDRAVRKHDLEVKAAQEKLDADYAAGLIP